jgi:hypothetical protein
MWLQLPRIVHGNYSLLRQCIYPVLSGRIAFIENYNDRHLTVAVLGDDARKVFLQSGLPHPVLGQIW